MARPTNGQVTERPWADGETITFGARLYAYGRRHRLVFGTNSQGWNRTRAEIELESILQRVLRGTWSPTERRTSVVKREAVRPDGHQPFAPFARKVADAKKSHGLDEDTIADLEWKLGYLVGHFGSMELLEIDVASTDGFRDELADRSRVIREAKARGRPLTETVRRRSGGEYERRKRPLSNTSINSILALLSQILQRAVDYSYIERNPMKVGQRKDRFLPSVKPARTFLEVDELHALLDAAGELDAAARSDRRIGRRAALATLALTGFRISELCDMRCSRVDLARARFKLLDSKTVKGIREVEMTLWNRDELARHREQRLRDGFAVGPHDHFFGAASGARRDPSRFRDRVLGRSAQLADKRRAEQGLPALPKITPHSLRRTWAMLAAQAGRDPHWISDQIGHTSAAFTLQVYQQTRHRRVSDGERQAIWELMRFADEPAECPFTRQVTRGSDGGFRPMNGPMGDFGPSVEADGLMGGN
ncbi:MAG TPA: tyrosine-type recombinase/integrase [Solirubrobacteraceae bacterium]|nr:tyrosine-type recombinase/integrase [Solirubrobacteraceae bacterium]